MPPSKAKDKEKKKTDKIVWNNNDCRADVCIRPPGTSSWVQCDYCSGWYHIDCLFMEFSDDIKDDKEFFCPNCRPEKEKELNDVRAKLHQKVEELAARQIEFGGLTIDRDMFREKKTANSYNYSTEFPPTLRDLAVRLKNKLKHKTIADFKYDYKTMCKRLTSDLKDEWESRVQMIEWELDDLAEDVFKPDSPSPEPSPSPSPTPAPDPTPLEYDLDKVKKETLGGSLGPGCEFCMKKFKANLVYGCKRNHQICDSCRKVHPGCICPLCQQNHGDRRRLFLDNTTSLIWRVANMSKSEVDMLELSNMSMQQRVKKKSPAGPASRKKKRKEGVESMESPMITNVWSYNESVEGSCDQIDVSGPIIKQEPNFPVPGQGQGPQEVHQGYEPQLLTTTTHQTLHSQAGVPTLDMSCVLGEEALSGQLLQLIDTSVVASSPPDTICSGVPDTLLQDPGDPLDQEPTNYNDPDTYEHNYSQQEQLQGDGEQQVVSLSEAEISQHIQSLQTPVQVTDTERRLLILKEELHKLVGLSARGAQVGHQVEQRRQEIHQLEAQLRGSECHEVIDPYYALSQLQSTAPSLAQPITNKAVSFNQQLGNMSWAQFKARATNKPQSTTSTSTYSSTNEPQSVLTKPTSSTSSSNNVTNQPVHQIQSHQFASSSTSQADVLARARKVLEARGCRCEGLLSVQEHSYTGPLSFSLLKNYVGNDLEWRPFLALFAANGTEMYQFQLGRAGHVFYIRAGTSHIENCRDRWSIQLSSPGCQVVTKGGLFTYLGPDMGDSCTPPHVLPTSIGPGDIRQYTVTVVQ